MPACSNIWRPPLTRPGTVLWGSRGAAADIEGICLLVHTHVIKFVLGGELQLLKVNLGKAICKRAEGRVMTRCCKHRGHRLQ